MKQGLFLIFVFCAISNAYAEADCLQRPSCEELGYTQTTEECAGRSILPCPFNIADPNTVFCGSPDADCPEIMGCLEYDSACACILCEDGFTLSEGICVDPCVEKCKIAYPLFNGRDNTKAAIEQIGNEALAAYAASQFYVGDKNGDFGQGKWYLPSIGEWMYLFGTDVNQMRAFRGAGGATGTNKALIDAALTTLQDKGVDARILKDLFSSSMGYLTSSEADTPGTVYLLQDRSGSRSWQSKNAYAFVMRSATLVKNCFTPSSGETAPKIGDVMYEDKTYGEAADYDGSKTPVGIIAAVSTSKRDVMVINLRNLSFSSQNTAGNFDPENPYNYSQYEPKARTMWSVGYEDIIEIPNFTEDKFLELAQASGNCPCQFYLPKVEDTCTGTNKCKDSLGNCVDCYASCSAYNSDYTDTEPSGYRCSRASVMIGSGNGATAAYKTCYSNCTCEGSTKCRYGNICVTCYASCSDFNINYKDSVPDGYTCSQTSVIHVGSGNGASAQDKTCYYNCSTI